MKTNKFITTGLALSTIFIGAVKTQATTISRLTIDSFDEAPQEISRNSFVNPVTFPATIEDNSEFASEILGGYRRLLVQANRSTSSPYFIEVTNNNDTLDNSFFNVIGSSLVTYDGEQGDSVTSGTPNNDLPLNLLEDGKDTNALAIDIINISSNTIFALTVEDSDGNEAMLSRRGLSSGTAIFDYEDFTLSGDTLEGIFGDVSSISFGVSDPTSTYSATFDNFRAVKTGVVVPEYSSVFSLLGLFGLAAVGLKNKVSKKS